MSYVCSHARGESRNESPFAFAAALQLTWSHTSFVMTFRCQIGLYGGVIPPYLSSVTVCTVNSRRAPSSPAGNEWNQLRSEIHVIAPVIVTVAQRVLTALILANKFPGERARARARSARGLFYRGLLLLSKFARAQIIRAPQTVAEMM